MLRIDGFTRFLLLDHAQDTVVQVLVKVLGIVEGCRASRALASSILTIAGQFAGVASRAALSAVGGCLFHPMNRSQVSLENIGPVEALLGGRARAWAEAAHHGTLVMGQGVSIFVILACKTFLVVLASQDGTFLGSLGLMGQHVGLEILENLSALRVRAATLFSTVFSRFRDRTWMRDARRVGD
jgi:hypothetical protein